MRTGFSAGGGQSSGQHRGLQDVCLSPSVPEEAEPVGSIAAAAGGGGAAAAAAAGADYGANHAPAPAHGPCCRCSAKLRETVKKKVAVQGPGGR